MRFFILILKNLLFMRRWFIWVCMHMVSTNALLNKKKKIVWPIQLNKLSLLIMSTRRPKTLQIFFIDFWSDQKWNYPSYKTQYSQNNLFNSLKYYVSNWEIQNSTVFTSSPTLLYFHMTFCWMSWQTWATLKCISILSFSIFDNDDAWLLNECKVIIISLGFFVIHKLLELLSAGLWHFQDLSSGL